MDRILLMDKKYQCICIPRKCSSNVTSAEESADSQVDSITFSVDTSQSLSPTTFVIAQRAMNKVANGGRAKGYATIGLNHMTFH